MLGGKYLVAPVIEKGIRERKVILPKEKWKEFGKYIGRAKPLRSFFNKYKK